MGVVDRSQLTATLKSATGGEDKHWLCADWLENRLVSSDWQDEEAVHKLTEHRAQFFRRNSGKKQEPRTRYTEFEIGVLLWELKSEVANVRCIRRCIGEKPEPLSEAMARVTTNFNRKLSGLIAEKGEIYAATIRSAKRLDDNGTPIQTRQTTKVTADYYYQSRTQRAIETICKNIPILTAVLKQDKVMHLGVPKDIDDE